jgi:1,4-dihydroxy-2-naphthoate octaprenyltransferase
MKNSFWQGFWRLADPKISLASMASILLGTCAAASVGKIDIFWLILTILGIFAIEVAKNASGEIFDFDSGNDQAVAEKDRSPFSGGKRVLVDGILTRNQVIGIASASYLIGIVIGLMIVIYREPLILWIGMLGVGAAYLYHAPPLKLSYRGMGEFTVALCYGPLIATGTYLVQRGQVTPQIIAVSSILGLLIANFLLINEFPDHDADKFANKNTLVVKLGRSSAARLFTWTFILALLGFMSLPLTGLPLTVWLGAIAIPTGISAATRLSRDPETVSNIIPAQANTLLTFLLFALGAGLGHLF